MFGFLNIKKDQIIALQKQNILLSQELEWANVFHDSIKGKSCLENLSLNIGRWAGSYSFFYILNRVLQDYKPNSILEMGLGESSKFIATYIENYLPLCKHIIIEHDEIWGSTFNERFKLIPNSTIQYFPLIENQVNGFNSYGYKDLDKKIEQKFELYIVDGPFGSDRFSRYDMFFLAQNLLPSDDFIILFDDTNRKGEEDTINAIINLLKENQISVYVQSYEGVKKSTIVASSKFKFATSF